MSGAAAERDTVNVQDYPPTDLLKLLASLLSQIASTNDALDSSGASTTTTTSSSASSSSSTMAGGLSNGTEHPHPPIWSTLTTASRTSLSTPSSPLTFHARNVPTISLEAYLLRILKYCPATNDVFLALLVYFDRMAKLSLEARGRAFVIDSYNVHRLVIAGVTVSSKFFSDVFYTNSRYAKVGGLPQAELNQLELQFLLLNDFRLTIPHEEMQRYAEQLILFSESSNSSTLTPNSNSTTPSSSSSSSSGAVKFVSTRKGGAGTDHDTGTMKTSTPASNSSRSSTHPGSGQVNGPGRPPAAHGHGSHRGVYPSSPGSSSSVPITHRTKSQSPRFHTPSSSGSASTSTMPQQPAQAHLSRGHRQTQVQMAMGAMDVSVPGPSSYGRQQQHMNGTRTPKAEAIGVESFSSPPLPRPKNRRRSSSPENPHPSYTHTAQPYAPHSSSQHHHPHPDPRSHPSSFSSHRTPSRGHGHSLSTSTSSSFDSDYDSSVCSSAYTTESESFVDDGSFVDEEGETDDETTIRAGSSRFSASMSEMGERGEVGVGERERERADGLGVGTGVVRDVQMASPSPH